MRIVITERLRPFSHRAGTSVLLPGSAVHVQVFPARIQLESLEGAVPQPLETLSLPIRGPVKEFTVFVDQEKACLEVRGRGVKGFFHYRLQSCEGYIQLHVLKGAEELKALDGWTLEQGVCLSLREKTYKRLSLGSHRKQELERLWASSDYKTLLPLLVRAADQLPSLPDQGALGGGFDPLLERCKHAREYSHDSIMDCLNAFLLAAFQGTFCPQVLDRKHQGIIEAPQPPIQLSSLHLLREGAKFIHSLFLQEKTEGLYVLPALPPELPCGRYIDIDELKWGTVSIEWTKKAIRRLILRVEEDVQLPLIFSKGVSSFRIRSHKTDSGSRCKVGKELRLERGCCYWLDRFES